MSSAHIVHNKTFAYTSTTCVVKTDENNAELLTGNPWGVNFEKVNIILPKCKMLALVQRGVYDLYGEAIVSLS